MKVKSLTNAKCRYKRRDVFVCDKTKLKLHFCSFLATGPFGGSCQIHGPIPIGGQSESEDLSTSATPIDAETGTGGIKSPIIRNPPKPPAFSHSYCPSEIHRSCFCVRFIAEHTKMQEDSTKVSGKMFTVKLSGSVRLVSN